MKKFSGMMAAIVLFVTIFANTAFAVSFTDITDDTQYRDAIITLTTLGLIKGYEDGTFRPSATITRAEFTVMVTRALAVDTVKVEGDAFTDVIDHYAKYNIKTAYDMGIVNGVGDGLFQPDSTVTYEQAVKMIICMLGYEPNALRLGGYPTGYMAVATQLGITNNITIAGNTNAPRGVIAQLLDAAINVNLQRTSVSASGEQIYQVTDDTLLSSKLKILKFKGTITGVYDSTIEGCDEKLLANELCILSGSDSMIFDFTSYFSNATDAKQYLGYSVTAYYKEVVGENPILVAMDKDTQKNTTIDIRSAQILDYKNNQLTYEKINKKEDRLKINPNDINIIYNGQNVKKDENITINGESYSYVEAISQWLSPVSSNFIYGELKVTDTGSDGTIDILAINNYKIMMASKAPTSADYWITDKIITGEGLLLDPDSSDYNYTVIKNNKQVEVTAIAANDVILYAASLDESLYTLYVTNKTVTGTISAFDKEESLVTINDTQYFLTDSVKKYVEGKTELKVGVTGTFNLDIYSNIVYCTIQESKAAAYGYIISVSESEDGETSYMTFFSPATGSTAKTLPMRSKITFNGNSTKVSTALAKLQETAKECRDDIDNKDEVYGSQAGTVSSGKYSQIARIDTSSTEVIGITTLSDITGEPNEDASKLVKYMPLGKYKYTANGNFNNEFYVNSSTMILYIPGNRSERADYSRGSMSSMFSANESYWVEAFDVNASKTAKIVLVYGNSTKSEIKKDSPVYIVAKEPGADGTSDDDVQRLTVYSSQTGSTTTATTADDTEFSNVQIGDVIQFGFNNRNRILNRHNLIYASDVSDVLDEGNTFDWTDDKFDISFHNSDGEPEVDETGAPYQRTFIANVLEVSTEDENNKYMRVSRVGFGEDGTWQGGDEERFDISKTIRIIRFDTRKNTFDRTVAGTSTPLAVTNLKDAKYNNNECSKVLLHVIKGEIKFMMIYE